MKLLDAIHKQTGFLVRNHRRAPAAATKRVCPIPPLTEGGGRAGRGEGKAARVDMEGGVRDRCWGGCEEARRDRLQRGRHLGCNEDGT
jgi:hypothetical protein